MASNKPRILVGADPELFLRDKKTGQLVAADINQIKGTKVTPYKVECGAVQVDGAAGEFNIDPASSASEFTTNIQHVMMQFARMVPDKEFVLDPTATFEPTYFSNLPDDIKELGCNPDFNAWTGQVNPPPDGESTTMRTASGHIHIGWTKNVNPLDPVHFKDCITVIRQMDYYLGLYSLLWDPDPKRRLLYGKAGAFRPKPYGAEYRTMSNVWLRSRVIQNWIYGAVQRGVTDLMSQKKPLFDQFGDYAQKVIDNNEVKWLETKEGQKVNKAIGMIPPDVRECLDYGKPKKEVGVELDWDAEMEKAKKRLASYKYS